MIGWKGGTPLEAVSITLSRILGFFALAVIVAIGFTFDRLFLIVRARLSFWSAEGQR